LFVCVGRVAVFVTVSSASSAMPRLCQEQRLQFQTVSRVDEDSGFLPIQLRDF
jgi:hypothetical protein